MRSSDHTRFLPPLLRFAGLLLLLQPPLEHLHLEPELLHRHVGGAALLLLRLLAARNLLLGRQLGTARVEQQPQPLHLMHSLLERRRERHRRRGRAEGETREKPAQPRASQTPRESAA